MDINNVIRTVNPLKLESYRAGQLLKFWHDLLAEALAKGYDDFEIVANEDDCWDIIGIHGTAPEAENVYPLRTINKVYQILP